MSDTNTPEWLARLTPDDLEFVRRFLLRSGSLKDIAAEYGVSYPTIRLRLDRLIERIKATEHADDDAMTRSIRAFVADGSLNIGAARILLDTYRKMYISKG